MVIKDSFNNQANFAKMTCPVFILHGQKDDLVPISHAQELYSGYDHEIDLVVSKEMGHGLINPKTDFIIPFQRFLAKIEARDKISHARPMRIIKIPRSLYAVTPQNGTQQGKVDTPNHQAQDSDQS